MSVKTENEEAKKLCSIEENRKGDGRYFMIYEIMHKDRIAASMDTSGECQLLDKEYLPFALYLEDTTGREEIDLRVNNLSNFYYWCGSRMLTLDRKYAKELLDSIGARQAVTDRDRAEVALRYHCLSLKDVFWVRVRGENISFDKINLYENHLDNALVDLSLRGKQMTVQNAHLIADDLSTNGLFPKAWVRGEDGTFYLYKDGNAQNVRAELLASRICRCFSCNQVLYEEGSYDGQPISISRLMTNTSEGLLSRAEFDIYAANHEINPVEYVLSLDDYSYYMMNLLDYLIGNTDRHWENWGFLIDHETNRPLRLHDLMDFNQAFQSYDSPEGANCEAALPRILTQKEAAFEAVSKIGLNQIAQVQPDWFDEMGMPHVQEMFFTRLNLLKEAVS